MIKYYKFFIFTIYISNVFDPTVGKLCLFFIRYVGFGGTFATKFADISTAMGQSKVESVAASGAEYVTAIDPSCLMHVQGMLSRNKMKAQTIHLASILASDGAGA